MPLDTAWGKPITLWSPSTSCPSGASHKPRPCTTSFALVTTGGGGCSPALHSPCRIHCRARPMGAAFCSTGSGSGQGGEALHRGRQIATSPRAPYGGEWAPFPPKLAKIYRAQPQPRMAVLINQKADLSFRLQHFP